jgi:predicted transcriptional regulator
MKKTTVINALSELPNEFNLDKLLERLLVIEKIEDGLKDVKAGKTISHDSAKKIISKWQR